MHSDDIAVTVIIELHYCMKCDAVLYYSRIWCTYVSELCDILHNGPCTIYTCISWTLYSTHDTSRGILV